MKTFQKLAGLLSGKQKWDLSEATFPPFKVVAVWTSAVVVGFLIASAVGATVASLWMPKVVPFSEGGAAQGLGDSVPLPARPMESEFRNFVQRNIFDSAASTGEEKKDTSCQPKKSELPLKFTGVIFGGRAEHSIVVLESTTDRKADTFLLGESVPGEAVISDILRDKVFLTRSGCPEYLELIQPELPKRRVAGERKRLAKPAVVEGGENSFKEDGFERNGTSIAVTGQWIEKAITIDFAKTLQDAKASPNQVNGEVKGFVLTRIRPDSVYEKMGMLDGDVIESINGIDLNDAARAIQTLNAMRNEKNLEIRMRRGSAVSNLNIQVK
jgi:general secretion pathway protein C